MSASTPARVPAERAAPESDRIPGADMTQHRTTPAARRVRQALAAAAVASGLFVIGCSDSPAALLEKAKEAIEKNEPKAAEIHLKNLLQEADNAEARFLLGKVYLEAGDILGAEKELQRAIEGGYDKAQVAPDLAAALVQMGQFRKVTEEFANVTPAAPEDKAELFTAVGRSHLALGKPDAAKQAFEGALAARPGHVPAQVSLIALKAAGGDLSGAAGDIGKVVEDHPESAEALVLKGDLELSQGRAREARDLYLRASTLDPRDRNSRAKLATLALTLDDLPAAEKAIAELRGLSGPAPLTMQLQSRLLLRQGKLEPARDAALAALKGAPDYLPALALSAQAHLALGAYEMAEQHARRIIDLEPSSTVGYQLLGATYVRMNAPDKAMQLLQPLLDRSQTRDAALYLVAGEAALRANEPDKAVAWFEQANKLAPKNTRSLTALALAHVSSGDRSRGIAELEQAAAMDSDSTQADYALVLTLIRDRQYDKALAAIDKLEQKAPGSAMAANLRGSVHGAKGDFAAARLHFEEAVKRDPKFFPATNNLARLDLRDRKVDDARKRYTTLLQHDPKNVSAMLSLAQIAQFGVNAARIEQVREDALAGKLPDPNERTATGRASPEALDWLKKAREADRTSIPAALALANWYSANGQGKDAIPLLQEMLAVHKDEVRLLDALGTAYLRTGENTLAMDTFERVLRLRPDSASLQLRMGRLKLTQGDTAGAMQNLRRAAELEPKAFEPRAAMAAVHLREGRPEEARKIAAVLQKEQPKNSAGMMLEGDIAMAERRFEDGVAAYRRAAIVEKSVPVQLKVHAALTAAGSIAEADALLQGLLKERADNAQLRLYAGEQEVRRKRWQQALDHYEAVLALQPGNGLALNNAAWALHELKDPKALEFAERAVRASPQSPAVLDTLGVILAARGEAARSVEVLRRAVAYGPNAMPVRLHLAEVLIKSGDKAGAKEQIDAVLAAIKAGPLAERAKELQQQL